MFGTYITKLISYATVIGGFHSAGIIDEYIDGQIDKCANYGFVIGSDATYSTSTLGCNNAGICGYHNRYTNGIKDCINYGTIIGGFSAHGISYGPYLLSRRDVCNCVNFGRIETKGYSFGIGEYTNAKNCVNYGNVSTAAIGNINNNSYKNTISNCYYLETSYLGKQVQGTTSMTVFQMKSQSFLNTLNSNVQSLGPDYSNWKFGKDGFPTLDWIEEE